MSIGGNGDDDDIERKLDRLVDEISELTRLLELALTAREPEAGDEDDDVTEGDLWEIGDRSVSVDTEGEYKRARVAAAKGVESTMPHFSNRAADSKQERLELRHSLFVQGFDNLQSIRSITSNDGFAEFIRLHAKSIWPSEDARELIDIVQPGPGFFGINLVGDEMTISQFETPFRFIVAWGYFYHPESQPWASLRLNEPQNMGAIESGRTFGEFTQKLAVAAFRVNRLPAKFVSRLPEDMQEEWRDRN